MSEGFRFVHLTDTHIMAGGLWHTRSGFDFDTEASLRSVVDAVRRLDPAPAFAVLGGDLASPDLLDRQRTLTADEYEPSYVLFRDILAGLPCPAYYLVGNHDHRVAFNRVLRPDAPALDAPCDYAFDHSGHHFVALDSQVPGEVGGALDDEQLAWLDDDLRGHAGMPTGLFVHHHPWPLGIQWLDALALRNGEALSAVLARHRQVRWIICGHVHLDQAVVRDGLTMLTTPSTCVQFSKVSAHPLSVPGPPGFRVVDVAGSSFSTQVLRLHGAAIDV
jgi:Icc protein